MAPLKGKKAWRKKIDASKVEEFLKAETDAARWGPAVESLPDKDLFFVDKAPEEIPTPVVRRRAAREPRLTRAQLIISPPQRPAPIAHPYRKPVGPLKRRAGTAAAAANAAASGTGAKLTGLRRNQTGQLTDIWGEDASPPKRRRTAPAVAHKIAAVEVDMAGCSYNPDREQHQDALALLVADEMKKVLKVDMQPAPVPLLIRGGEGPDVDPLMALQVEGERDEDEDGAAADGNEDGADGTGERKKRSKKTKQDRNKEKRRRDEEAVLAARRALKAQRNAIDGVKTLQQTLDEQTSEQQRRQQRREIIKAEKASHQPPKIGRLRFQPASVQVLTSDELGDGLRRLTPCAMLATERFKSLQKRGLVETRKPVPLKARARMFRYEKGGQVEKATAMQKELVQMQRKRQQLQHAEKQKSAKKVL